MDVEHPPDGWNMQGIPLINAAALPPLPPVPPHPGQERIPRIPVDVDMEEDDAPPPLGARQRGGGVPVLNADGDLAG